MLYQWKQSIDQARGYGFETFFLETITETGPSTVLNIGDVLPGMHFTEAGEGVKMTLKEAFKGNGLKGVAKEIFNRAGPGLKDALGEGVQEIFQTGVENILYNSYFDDGVFDPLLNDRRDFTDGMAESFWELLK